MNLRIADARALVAFLHRAVSTSGKRILTSGGYDVVEIDGRVFYHGSDPVEVGGPFRSLEHLVRSEGLRRYPEESPADGADFEVFEWAGSFFRIDLSGADRVRRYADLEQAMAGGVADRWRRFVWEPGDLRVVMGPAGRPASAMPILVAHADWGSDPKKRWMCVAERSGADRFQVSHPELVGDASTLLRRLHDRAGGGHVVVGFDFPIGVPAAYASRAGVERFPEFLAQLGRDGWGRFYDVAEKPHEVGVRRPFYPMRNGKKGEVTQRHLLEGLGVASMNELLRACDRSTASRGAACPIFWTLGGKQVGKAAIIGWREVLTPALNDADMDVGLWPFDGSLDELVRQRQIVIVETYPAEACTHLGLSPPGRGWSKRSQEGRRAQVDQLYDWVARRPVELAPELTAAIDDGFGPSKDAEDPFDAVVGLLSMLEVLMGYRAAGAPKDGSAAAVEGWILGQADPLLT